MKTLKKSGLSMAIVAGLVATGMSGISNQAQAMPQLPDGATAAPHVAVDGLGQVLIFPYYTVRNGFASFFNITNTSPNTIAVKMRYREGFNSRDALDFNIILSPYDVWTGWVEDGDDGPVARSNDNTCVSGAPLLTTTGQPLTNIGYAATGYEDLGSDDIDRTREGYVEMIVMGRAANNTEIADDPLTPLTDESNVAYNAKHVSGVPRDCAKVDAYFVSTAGAFNQNVPAFADAGGDGDGDPAGATQFIGLAINDNPLKGNFSIINQDVGIGGGNTATAIANFNQGGASLVTAQSWPWFLEPTLASGDGIWTTTGLPEVETSLSSVGIANEWAHNAATGAETDWIVTFPTKSFHVDYLRPDGTDADALPDASDTNILAAVNRWRGTTPGDYTWTDLDTDGVVDAGETTTISLATGTAYAAGGVFPLYNPTDEAAPVAITLTGYDREELEREADTGTTTPSPFPPVPPVSVELPRETNVISFRATGSELSSETFVLNFDASTTLDGAINGWTRMRFGNAIFGTGPNQNSSLPAVGWAYKTRDQGNPALAYGQLMGHAHLEEAP